MEPSHLGAYASSALPKYPPTTPPPPPTPPFGAGSGGDGDGGLDGIGGVLPPNVHDAFPVEVEREDERLRISGTSLEASTTPSVVAVSRAGFGSRLASRGSGTGLDSSLQPY